MTVAITELINIPILAQSAPECLDLLANRMVMRTYFPGELIFLEGEDTAGIWFVLDGKVKIMKLSANGRIQALCIANMGKCFGTCPLFNGNHNPATAEAITEVRLVLLPQHALNDLMHDNRSFAWALLKIYSQYLAQLAKLSEGLGSWSVNQRINDTLLTHAEAGIVTLTHEKIAELSGTVREVVTRYLTTLSNDALIQVESGRITLLNPEALQTPCLSRR